ncbi:MAG: ABC transporter ATP-binding protein, partial [Thermoprotei archaeon]
MDYAIKAINLTKIYSNNVIGNDKVNLKIKYGENFSLLSPNGAGKTTFVRMVSTELLPTSGRLTVLGYDVVKNPMSVRKNIGVVPQEGLPVMDLTVYDHIYYFSRLRGLAKNDAKSATIRAIRELDLVDVRNRYVGGLSGGLKKRVLLATAIVHEPRLLILDEPTTGLDPAARRKLWNYLEKVKKEGTTILMTTHYVEEAERLSD